MDPVRAVRPFHLLLLGSLTCAVMPVKVGAKQPSLQTSSALQVRNVADDDMTAYLIGDQLDSQENGEVVLTGDAQVRRIDSVSKGDQIRYDRNTGDVKVRGNGVLMRGGSIIRSPSIDYNMKSEEGALDAMHFWLEGGSSGTAEAGTIYNSDHMKLDDVLYSACPCPDPAWYIKAPEVNLYVDENRGVARNSVLYFKDVPIFYSPYFSFPLREERKSGFLTPVYGFTSNSGLELALPYYFNLAPNYDATLTPRSYSKRGLQLDGEFRYLGRTYEGQINGSYLNRDSKTREKRWMLSTQHRQSLGYGFGLSMRYNRVSDDNYFRDLTSIDLGNANINSLASSAAFTWSGAKYFNASLSVTQYQTLQDDTAGYRKPEYNRMPSLSLRGARYNWGGFDVVSENAITRFEMPFYSGTLSNFDEQRRRRDHPNGTRMSSLTSVSYPMIRPYGYITPKASLHLSQYDTEWRKISATSGNKGWRDNPRSKGRALPLFSLDSGLYFERDTSLFGNAAVQTLEPRMYYLYVPYQDQSMLPVFDTGVASFNFSQAFSENIYSGGWDRIANANQLTLGLTTRWLDADTGEERVMLQVAQRLYFEDQKVFLHNAANNEYPETRRRSDYLFGAGAALTDTLNLRMDAQYNPQSNRTNRLSAGLRWQPQRLASLSASYRYERDPRAFDNPDYFRENPNAKDNGRERVSFTTQWPVSNRVFALGRLDYSLQEKRSTQSIVGLEYKGDCCWAARFVVQRYAVSAQKSNSAVFFQLELSGLGAIGPDPMKVLRERIVGYEPITPSSSETTTFERYE